MKLSMLQVLRYQRKAKKTPDRRKLIKKMDKLFSDIIRSQGVCDKCGSTRNLQCAHVISRRHLKTRFDLENGLCLCVKCHLFEAHREPHEFVRWFDNKYGGSLYEELKKRANDVKTAFDHEGTYKKLKDLHERIADL